MDLSDYILKLLRKKKKVVLKLVLVERKYDTIKGRVVVEEVDLIINDTYVVEDFGLEVFVGFELKELKKLKKKKVFASTIRKKTYKPKKSVNKR